MILKHDYFLFLKKLGMEHVQLRVRANVERSQAWYRMPPVPRPASGLRIIGQHNQTLGH